MTGNAIVEKSTKRELNFEASETKTHDPIINKKLNPPLLPDGNVSHKESYFTVKYFIWLMMNGMNQFHERNNQVVPNFAGNKKHMRWLVFTPKMCERHLSKSDTLCKDAVHPPASLLKI